MMVLVMPALKPVWGGFAQDGEGLEKSLDIIEIIQ